MQCPFAYERNVGPIAVDEKEQSDGTTDRSTRETKTKDSTYELQQNYFQQSVSQTSKDFQWPTLTEVTTGTLSADYNDIFTNRSDTRDGTKLLCANGYTATVRFEVFPDCPYTGLFQGAEHGIIRLSNALDIEQAQLPYFAGSLASTKLFPCVALKFFRGGDAHSGNMLLAGKKIGQDTDRFFEHGVCTHLTEKVPFLLRWVQNIFNAYSQYATQLGVSDFAFIDQHGVVVKKEEINFPWCVALYPPASCAVECRAEAAETAGKDKSDTAGNCSTEIGIQQLKFSEIPKLKSGSCIYDVYVFPNPSAALQGTKTNAGKSIEALTGRSIKPKQRSSFSFFSPTPTNSSPPAPPPRGKAHSLHLSGDAAAVENEDVECTVPLSAVIGEDVGPPQLHRIGRIVTTSAFYSSDAANSLYFKHQRKEEDYILRPEWKKQVTEEHAMIGATSIEQLIQHGIYLDLER